MSNLNDGVKKRRSCNLLALEPPRAPAGAALRQHTSREYSRTDGMMRYHHYILKSKKHITAQPSGVFQRGGNTKRRSVSEADAVGRKMPKLRPSAYRGTVACSLLQPVCPSLGTVACILKHRYDPWSCPECRLLVDLAFPDFTML